MLVVGVEGFRGSGSGYGRSHARPFEGYPRGHMGTFLEPICGFESPHVKKINEKLTFDRGSKGLAWEERNLFHGLGITV